ncbi:MAG: protein translocase SEC61 complex subunit gamma [Candidatus Bathyarchaeota archaeon]
MGIKSFLESCKRLVKLIGKPETKELSASIRISVIGLGVLGILGFIIKLLATMFQAIPPTT